LPIEPRLKLLFGQAGSSTSSDNVPNGNWNRDDQQANLSRNDPDNRNSNNGVRAGVKDYYLAQGS
jgi:hypothetical protein